MINLKIAQRIKELRKENKISQSEFGEMIGVSQDTVSLWEQGKSLPNTEYVIIIAERFEITSDYLLGLSEY